MRAKSERSVEAKEGAEHESNTLLMARNAEIGLLGSRLENISTELDGERKELGLQIDELRQAGQVRVFALLIFVSDVLLSGNYCTLRGTAQRSGLEAICNGR